MPEERTHRAAATRRRSVTDPLVEVLEERAAEELGDGPWRDIVDAIEEMVSHPDYPCLGARSVFRRSAVTMAVLDALDDTSSGGSLDQLAVALGGYAQEVDHEGDLVSFVACFRSPIPAEERDFERLLWNALQHLHERDDAALGGGRGR